MVYTDIVMAASVSVCLSFFLEEACWVTCVSRLCRIKAIAVAKMDTWGRISGRPGGAELVNGRDLGDVYFGTMNCRYLPRRSSAMFVFQDFIFDLFLPRKGQKRVALKQPISPLIATPLALPAVFPLGHMAKRLRTSPHSTSEVWQWQTSAVTK